ncbi:MAG TPA: histidine ammonia-lyase [Thermoanaerobaculia bacterium]|nr:histidine ammonia-lyase [Thermoanaerobaculia bacterium]
MERIELDGESLTLADLERVARREAVAVLAEPAVARMRASREIVERYAAEGKTVYGVTTGFGVFADVAISPENVRELQRNLILSHCAGVGEPLSPGASRTMMLLRANALAKGYSGIRVSTVELLLRMLEQDLVPVIPSQGSVGASGDLAPLAHLAAAMMGEGEVWHRGVRGGAGDALREIGAAPVVFEAKEGLAMINGTQAICAIGGLALARAARLLDLADVFAALTLDALEGTDVAFDRRIHDVRPHAGQGVVARRMRALLAGSPLRESHLECPRVQDAYSLRCVPQVHGAVRDAVRFSAETIRIEINSATDNPLVFENGDVLSGGNFHGAPAGLACDLAAIALTDLASISERRVERLVNPALSGLPTFLVAEGGLHSGFMMAQVTAAALVSESKSLAHPASVDSIPTSAGKEDHVSMGPIAARKLERITANLANVLAIEAMCGAQALEFRRPLRSSPLLERAHGAIRSAVAPWRGDRYLHADLVAMEGALDRVWEAVGAADGPAG